MKNATVLLSTMCFIFLLYNIYELMQVTNFHQPSFLIIYLYVCSMLSLLFINNVIWAHLFRLCIHFFRTPLKGRLHTNIIFVLIHILFINKDVQSIMCRYLYILYYII